MIEGYIPRGVADVGFDDLHLAWRFGVLVFGTEREESGRISCGHGKYISLSGLVSSSYHGKLKIAAALAHNQSYMSCYTSSTFALFFKLKPQSSNIRSTHIPTDTLFPAIPHLKSILA
jgi:hypothetical protein